MPEVNPRQDGSDRLLLSANQVAELLGVSVRTLWRLLSAGKLPAPVRLGGSVRWRNADIRQWIDEGCPPPVRTPATSYRENQS